MDFTVTNLEIKSKDFEDFISIIEVRNNDESYFEVTNLKDTRIGNINKGCSLSIIYHNGKSKFPLSLDITSGESLLPVEKTEIPLFFEEGSVTLYAYPIEQVLSDKLYTTLAYGKVDDTNSRAKDLYDIYFIFNHVKFDPLKVRESFEKTSMQRNINFTKKRSGYNY